MSDTKETESEISDAGSGDEIPKYETTLVIVCAICGAGPLALPLVWRHPRMRWWWKVLITIGVALLTWGCIWLTKVLIVIFWEQLQLIMDAYGVNA